MKKLIVVVCTIAVAAVSQAAQFVWSVNGCDSDWTVPNHTWDNASFYVLADGKSIPLAGLENASWFANANIASVIEAMVDDGDFYVTEMPASFNFGGDTDMSKTWTIAVVDTANGYFTFDTDMNGYSATAMVTDKTNYIFADDLAAGWAANDSKYTPWAVAPEPTSGLLLLLGMAGLALRRKQA